MEPELLRFIQQHPALSVCQGDKVRCSLTNHELPCRLADLQAYTSGKKYQRLVTSQPFRYEQFEPHVVPSTKNPQQLFCKLTLRHINRIPQHVLRHVNGKRYQKAQHQYEVCQRTGIPYVPACMSGKNKKRRDGSGQAGHQPWEPDTSEGEEADSDDSLSDLYPKEIFKRDAPGKGEENDEFLSDDEESEKMEVESQAQGKRKKKQPTSSSKKLKIGCGQPGSRRGKHTPRVANRT